MVLLAALGPLAWGIGVMGAAVACSRRLPLPPCSRVGRAAFAIVGGWVLAGLVMVALAVSGLAAAPGTALAPALLGLLVLRRPAIRTPEVREAGRPPWNLLAVGLALAAAARVALHLARWPWAQAWSWDAYAVWGLKARQLVAHHGFWRLLSSAPSHPFSHGEYPLLVPAHMAAMSWPEGGVRLAAVPDAVLALAVLVAWHELWRRRIGGLGAAACTLLLAWPVQLWGADLVGLADRQLALLAGLAVAVACGQLSEGGRPLLALLACGVGLTKNEGLPFAVLLVAAVVIRDRARSTNRVLAAALLPPLTWLAAMHALHLDSDRLTHFATAAPGAWSRLGAATLSLAMGGGMIVPLAAATAAVAIATLRSDLRWLAAAVAGQAALVAFVALHGPYELDVQLETTLPRLLAQLLPPGLALVAGLAMMREPASHAPPA